MEDLRSRIRAELAARLDEAVGGLVAILAPIRSGPAGAVAFAEALERAGLELCEHPGFAAAGDALLNAAEIIQSAPR